MATKVIYFSVGGIDEQAEFRSDDPPDDIKGLFLAAKRRLKTSETFIFVKLSNLTALKSHLISTNDGLNVGKRPSLP